MCGEAEHDADVLLSLSALIKATELWIVFEGILLKDTPIKVHVLRASEEREKPHSTTIFPVLRRLNTRLTISCHFQGMMMKLEDGGGEKNARV